MFIINQPLFEQNLRSNFTSLFLIILLINKKVGKLDFQQMMIIEQIIKEDMIIQIQVPKPTQVKMQYTQNQNEIDVQMYGQGSKDQFQKYIENKNKLVHQATFLTIWHNQIESKQSLRKYRGKTQIVGKDALFLNCNDVALFFRGKGNYLWDSDNKVLNLFISTVGINFGRNRKIEIQFQEIEISNNQKIEAQNKILRKQLQYFKSQSLNVKNNLQMKYQLKQRYNQNLIQMKAKPEIYKTDDNGQPSLCKLPILLGDRIQFIRNQIQQAEESQKHEKQAQKIIPLKKQRRKIPRTLLSKRYRREKRKLKKITTPRKTIAPYKITKLPRKSKSEPSSPVKEKNKTFQSQQSMGTCLQKSRTHIQGNQYSISFISGSSYYGELKQDKFHGKGRFICKKYTYDGTWKNGKPHGYGVTSYSSGAYEKGFYRNGLRFGKGQDKFDNGQSYIGDFKNQQRNGYGTYYFKNNQRYQGEWKNNLQHGKGTEYFSNGSRFEGTWVFDEKHGQGENITKQGRTKQLWDNGKLIKQIVILNSEQE